MYSVVVAPRISNELVESAAVTAFRYGKSCSDRFISAYENAVASLQLMPQRGSKRLEYIAETYRVIPFWKYLWLVYQIDEENLIVHIDYLIDERSEYGSLIV